MKLFNVGLGWSGSVLVAADSAEEAVEIVKTQLPHYAYEVTLKNTATTVEVPLERGLIHIAHQKQH